MKVKRGDRVGALCGSDGKTIKVFGYGVYEGEAIPAPEDGISLFGMPMKNPNPKIRLDSGEVVWGCECYWGPEDWVRKELEGKPIVVITPAQFREEKARVEKPQEA